MSRLVRTKWLGLLILGCMSTPLMADDVEAVDKAILEKIQATKSLRAKMTQEMSIVNEQMKNNMHGEGAIEAVRKDGKSFHRMESKIKSQVEVAGNKIDQEQSSLSLSDGEWTYVVGEYSGTKNCQKTKNPEKEPLPLEVFRKTGELKLLPEETVDGVKCWVIEHKPTGSMQPGMPSSGRSVLWFRQDCGMMAKMVGYDEAGKEFMTTRITNVELDVSIPADHFAFKAPDGVECLDMTEQMKAAAGAASSATDAPPGKE